MKKIEEVTPTGAAATADEPVSNRYMADALEQVGRLRMIRELFPDEPDARELTPHEIRLANVTRVEALEEAATFAQAQPNVGGSLSNVEALHDTIQFVLAYERVRGEAMKVLRHIDRAILRRKLKGVRLARGLYVVAKAYAARVADESAKTHVQLMQRSLVRRRKTKPAPPADPEATAKK
ncbi:MAG TPA: hypothetical protein VGF28_24270 [Thermoanaerobaculia bacterium]|jgi:hypothetical protein